MPRKMQQKGKKQRLLQTSANQQQQAAKLSTGERKNEGQALPFGESCGKLYFYAQCWLYQAGIEIITNYSIRILPDPAMAPHIPTWTRIIQLNIHQLQVTDFIHPPHFCTMPSYHHMMCSQRVKTSGPNSATTCNVNIQNVMVKTHCGESCKRLPVPKCSLALGEP